jgi:uncharacterized protein YkuJ
MQINNRESADYYYHIVNELVNNYIEKWKIRPSNLKKYLKKGTNRWKKFIEANGLSGIGGIDTIISDVIDDRLNLENDQVFKFENFKMLESLNLAITDSIYTGIQGADINYEKRLADYFDTNLSAIDIIDSQQHIFEITDWDNKTSRVIIYSSDDIDLIADNIFNSIWANLSKKTVNIDGIIDIDLGNIVDFDLFNDNYHLILPSDKVLKILSDVLGGEYLDGGENYHIWRVKNATS